MGQIPDDDLETLTVNDHIAHHEQLHAEHNLIADASSLIGDGVVTNSNGATGDLVARQSHYNDASTHAVVTHSSNGPLTFTVQRNWRSLQINASADIAGATITGMDDLGPSFAQLPCRLVATDDISVDLSTAGVVQGAAPATLDNGDEVTFRIERWA